MGCEGIEVHVQAITGEDRQAVGGQELSKGVDNQMRRVLRAGSQLEYGKNRA
jgi:hypothetical protein